MSDAQNTPRGAQVVGDRKTDAHDFKPRVFDAQKLREAIQWVRGHYAFGSIDALKSVCDAAEKHLATLPQTKMVDVWHVEYVYGGIPCCFICADISRANEAAEQKKRSAEHRCVRVTGPHKHVIPA